MYRYLDRRVADLREDDVLLVSAMRAWTLAARSGRCRLNALTHGFAVRAVRGTLEPFAAMMGTIDVGGLGTFRFGGVRCPLVGDDEARLLAFLALAAEPHAGRALRAAEALVVPASVAALVASAAAVARALAAAPG